MDGVLPWRNECFRRTYSWHSLYPSNKLFTNKIWNSSRNFDSSESKGRGTRFNLYKSCTWLMQYTQKLYKILIINLRMGGFHACGIFLAVIGKRFEPAGLHDLIVEPRLSGPDSINQILNGKEYNYGIRTYKVIFEALHVLEEWLQKEKKSNILTNY